MYDELTSVQQATIDKAQTQYEAVRKEWAVHTEKKMAREVVSRLKSMREFFRECRESMKLCSQVYPTEAQRRTIVQELLMAMDEYGYDTHEVITKAQETDGELRRWITAGEFLWDEQLQAIYPHAKVQLLRRHFRVHSQSSLSYVGHNLAGRSTRHRGHSSA